MSGEGTWHHSIFRRQGRLHYLFVSSLWTTSASFFVIPLTAVISSTLAADIRFTEPNALSSAWRRAGPMPGMSSSLDLIWRFPRRRRCLVIAKRWASSLSCCSSLRADELFGREIGSLFPGTNISSSRFARPITGKLWRPRLSNFSLALESCPLPPSISIRSGYTGWFLLGTSSESSPFRRLISSF